MTKLTNKQVNLLEAISEKPLHTHVIADELGLTTSQVQNGMRRLEDRFYVRRIQILKESLLRWELTSTGRRELRLFLTYRD